MRRQVELYSYMQDAKKVQLCARTIHPNIYRSAFFISADQTKTQTERENARSVKPPRIGDVQASVAVLMTQPSCLNGVGAFSTDFLHLKLHAAC
ncbi:hypothetical protein AVEN_13516-1 [Araneus ventricosus]|uniref:Uncharacterized protein n=1 Tax=Araneus ventricosus TaxID=182803 RepID=A0A4Y2LMN6_ARAVE|nr:hypothetical protein AVEN_13516-1 [Araneus ventricosus]